MRVHHPARLFAAVLLILTPGPLCPAAELPPRQVAYLEG